MHYPSHFARLTKRKPVLQPISYPGSEVLRFFHYTSGSVKLVWHHHPELEIVLVIRGSGHHIAGDIARQYGPGDLVFLGSDLPHARYSVPAPGDHLEHIIIQFRPDFLGRDFLAAAENNWLPVLFQKALPGLQVTGKTHEASEELLRGMVSMSPEDRLIELLKLLRLWSQSTHLKPISSLCTPASGNKMTDEKLQRILNYIQQNLDGEIRQDEAARLLRMSPASFSRFFRQNARKTFIGMVNELRVGEAGRLLVETDAPVTEIAMAVGYSNLSNFNEQFRKIRGMTPRDYRNVMIRMLTHPEEIDPSSPGKAGSAAGRKSGRPARKSVDGKVAGRQKSTARKR